MVLEDAELTQHAKSLPVLLAGAAPRVRGFHLRHGVLGTVLFEEQHKQSHGVSRHTQLEPNLISSGFGDPRCQRDVWKPRGLHCKQQHRQSCSDAASLSCARRCSKDGSCVLDAGARAAGMLWWILASWSCRVTRGTESSPQNLPVGTAPRSSMGLVASRCPRCFLC